MRANNGQTKIILYKKIVEQGKKNQWKNPEKIYATD